jgi:hypothetical protein
MSAISSLAAILIATHPNSAAHFSEFQKQLPSAHLELIAFDVAAKVAQQHGASYFDPLQGAKLSDLSDDERSNLIAVTLNKIDSLVKESGMGPNAKIIVDIDDLIIRELLTQMRQKRPHLQRYIYYDSPESYVPGGYSSTANKIIPLAQSILFANANLARYPLYFKPNIPIQTQTLNGYPIGYHPLQHAEKLKQLRTPQARYNLLNALGLPSSSSQKILVYAGESSDLYYYSAFPAFITMLNELSKSKDLSSWTVILQQDPKAAYQNIDANQLLEWKKRAGFKSPQVFISPVSFDQAFAAADVALCHEMPQDLQLLLAAIPTIQVAYDSGDTLATRLQLVSNVNDAKALFSAVEDFSIQPSRYSLEDLHSKLGIEKNWQELFVEALK